MRPFIPLLIITTLCACFALAPTPAAAQTAPAVCDSVREVRFFLLGVRKGRSLAEQAIATLDTADICADPDAITELQVTVVSIADGIVVPPDVSDAVRCHVLGQVAGLVAEVTDLQDTCVNDACIADGEFIGEISAQLYCDLSIALGGLGLADLFERLATDACGEAFQDACDATFFATAATRAACVPFTIAPFADVFALTQNNQCADNPAPPP